MSLKAGFENRKWNYPDRKWNYFFYFLTFDQKSSFTKWFQLSPTSLKLVLKTENGIIVKTQHNSTQLKATLKQLALELDTVVTCSNIPPNPTPPRHPQTFHPLLDELES